MIYAVVGVVTYPGINIFNSLDVKGMEKLHQLPKQNVLFVSNHQTYFADVISFKHIFCTVKWGKKSQIGLPYYVLWPFTTVRYIVAEETMKKSLLTRIFAMAGAITV